MMSTEKLTFIDLFAGIGGFRLGMEQAGHKCVGFIEIDKFAVKSYREMYNTEGEFFSNDIRTVKPEELPDADIYCGGFPCQSFSIAGNRGGFEDNRGTLFFEIMRLAKHKKPRYLLLENVKGLLSHEKGNTFQTILRTIWEHGYDCQWQILNSKNFNLPQNRERVYIIANLRNKSFRQILPIVGTTRGTLKKIISGAQAVRVSDTNGISSTLSSQGGGLGAKTGLYFVDLSKINPKVTENARCIQARYDKGVTNRQSESSGVLEIRPCLTPDRINKRQNGRRFKEDGDPMFTLTAQDKHGVLIKNGSDVRIRKLTPKECFRLQGFPDALFKKASEVNSDTQLYKQAGNAVSVPVVYEIAKRLEELT